MTTGNSTFSDAVRQAERSFTAPGFSTLTENLKRITVLRRAVRNAGGDPVGTSFPGPGDQPAVIAALETQLRNLLDAANIAAPYNESLIESSGPDIDIQDDPRLLATEGGLPPQDPAPQPTPAPQITPLQERTIQAISDAEAALEDSTGFQTLSQRQQIVTKVRRAIIDAGGVPIGPEFPSWHEAGLVIAALYKQLEAVLNAANLADGYRESHIESNTPEISIASDPRLITTEGDGQLQSAYVDPALQREFESLKEAIRAEGVSPEVTEAITPLHLEPHIERLRTQLDRIKAVKNARMEITQSSLDSGLFTDQELQIMALQQAIRDLGGSPVVSGSVEQSGRAGAIARLNAQLRFIFNPGNEQVIAPEEFSSTANFGRVYPDRSDAVGETDLAGGLTPEQAALDDIYYGRAYESGSNLPRGFDEFGVNKNANSTDSLSEVAPFDSSQYLDFSEYEVPYFFEYVQQLNATGAFRESDLAVLSLVMWAIDPGLNSAPEKEQELYFLRNLAGLVRGNDSRIRRPKFDLSEDARNAQSVDELTRAIDTAFPGDSGKFELDIQDFFPPDPSLTPGQLVPDSVADDLPLPLKIFVKAALDFTDPLNVALLLVPLGGGLSLARVLTASLAGSLVSEIADEANLPPEVQVVASFLTEAAVQNPSAFVSKTQSIFNQASATANATGDVLGSGVAGLGAVGRITAREGAQIVDELITGKGFQQLFYPTLSRTGRTIVTEAGNVIDTSSPIVRQLTAAAVRESTQFSTETKKFLATTLEKDMLTATQDIISSIKNMDSDKRTAALLFAQAVDSRAKASGFNPLEQARIDTSVNGLQQVLELGIFATRNTGRSLAERGEFPYFTMVPATVFEDIKVRIEAGDDLNPIERERAFRAVGKLATGRGPDDAEFDLLSRIFDGPDSSGFADTVKRAVASNALVADSGWTARPERQEPKKRTLIDVFKRPPFPTFQFPGAYGR